MEINDLLIEQQIYQYIINIKNERLRKEVLLECKVLEYKANDFIYISTEKTSTALIFLSGKVNVRAFVNESTDYIIPWNNSYWFGALSIAAEDYTECELFFSEDTKVLSFPLKKILYYEPKENYKLWMKISKMSALALRDMQKKAIKRAALSNESYFLTLLIENGYQFKNLSIPELAGRMKINTRTLQRVIQKLEIKDLIVRNKVEKSIRAKDNAQIDEYYKQIIK